MIVAILRLTEDIYRQKWHPHSAEPDISTLYASSIAKKYGMEVTFLDCSVMKMNEEDIINSLPLQTSVFLIHTKTPTYHVARRIAKAARKKNKDIIIIGAGQHPTTIPADFLDEKSPFDCCIRGEYEAAWEEIISLVVKRKGIDGSDRIDGVCMKGKPTAQIQGIKDIDVLGLPDHKIVAANNNYFCGYPQKSLRRLRWRFIETTRGCPFDCVFCSPTLRISHGKEYRRRSVDMTIKEIRVLINHGINAIRFLDDNFINDKKEVEAFCRRMIHEGFNVKWTCQSRVDHIDDSILDLMRRAGCVSIAVGVESGNNRILEKLNKKITKEVLREKINMIKKHDLWTICYFMIANPTETEEEVADTLQFCKELRPKMLQVAFFTPYPGSQYFDRLPENKKKKDTSYSHYNSIIHNFSRIKDEKLFALQKSFYMNYFFSADYLFKVLPKVAIFYLINTRILFKLGSETIGFAARRCVLSKESLKNR